MFSSLIAIIGIVNKVMQGPELDKYLKQDESKARNKNNKYGFKWIRNKETHIVPFDGINNY